ncbi:hypothetical protein GQX74_001948, partial [Glossina fuscipes]
INTNKKKTRRRKNYTFYNYSPELTKSNKRVKNRAHAPPQIRATRSVATSLTYTSTILFSNTSSLSSSSSSSLSPCRRIVHVYDSV